MSSAQCSSIGITDPYMQLAYSFFPGISLSFDWEIPPALGITLGLGLVLFLYLKSRRTRPVRRVYGEQRPVRDRALFIEEEDAASQRWWQR